VKYVLYRRDSSLLLEDTDKLEARIVVGNFVPTSDDFLER
jgi:hypothetical protein